MSRRRRKSALERVGLNPFKRAKEENLNKNKFNLKREKWKNRKYIESQ